MSSTDSSPGKRSLRDLLLDAAATAISEVGADKVSLRAIARRVGVSHQSPGHYFRHRTGVLTALAARVVRQLGDEMLAARDDAAARGVVGRDIVTEIGACYVQFAIERTSLFGLANNPDVLDHDSPELRHALDATWGVLTGAVHDAQDHGWRRGEPAEDVAMMCWSIVHGLAVINNARLRPTELQGRDTVDILRAVSSLL